MDMTMCRYAVQLSFVPSLKVRVTVAPFGRLIAMLTGTTGSGSGGGSGVGAATGSGAGEHATALAATDQTACASG